MYIYTYWQAHHFFSIFNFRKVTVFDTMLLFKFFFTFFMVKVRGFDLRDMEIVLLPLWDIKGVAEVPLAFEAFGQFVKLNLRRNNKIVSPRFQVWKHNEDGIQEELYLNQPTPCHYLHSDSISSAAISVCQNRGIRGLVFLENITLEITPVEDTNFLPFNSHLIDKRSEIPFGEAHIIKRAYAPLLDQDFLPIREGFLRYKQERDISTVNEIFENFNGRQRDKDIILELAVFFDEAGYKLFSPFLDEDDEKIRDMLLAYINGIQALYHQPSLGKQIDISLVRLDLMRKQPSDLPHFNGERSGLLNSFCNYAKSHNPPKDDDPNHWDLGLYVSGLDFYVMENGIKNFGTMGLAAVGGICIDQYSCVIAEFGVTNEFGKPYPSAGFTSIYIAAHEIGHNLGMHHDSTRNSCPKEGYIMSPSRGVQGETTWSRCSRAVVERLAMDKSCLLDRTVFQEGKLLDHTKFYDLPGREWTAKKQCELLLLDRDATVVTLHKACQSLQCKSSHRSGYYFAGPALDGTYCAPGKECRNGECLPAFQFAPTSPPQVEGWSSWKEGPCRSGCLSKSMGAREKHRFCNDPKPLDFDTSCKGLHYDVELCRDDKLCGKKKRKTSTEFVTAKCKEFSRFLPEVDAQGSGLQALHEPERPWVACALFCRRKDIASYYTPRVELNDLGLDPYFPDGTWCHEEGGQDYFCRRHRCVPEKLRFAKVLDLDDDFLQMGPQNARPGDRSKPSGALLRYLSLGLDGLPLLTFLPNNLTSLDDTSVDEWFDNDYIDLSKS